MPGGLTRKERRRWETSRRLELQMSRLNSNAAVAKEMIEESAAQRRGTASDVVDGDAVAAPEPKLRHDPKFKHGTFWRDRKEKKARTLFLGGIPSAFSVKQVKDFISTVIDLDPGAAEYANQVGQSTEVVEEVDMLPVKHHSKVKHMYVTMASIPLAGCAAAVLNGYRVEGRELRCNFAADKAQREEAIRRRNAAQR
ncbi:putative RNA binding protein [Leishmania major strain Friedlin]|uniref:Putative RNA binding protein n=1 Tax=Leishmania major TaxID=5664 RepID=Q4Q8Q4_LEIMA|nr:putative RNA binding protein [Leishmania major strain Friedlin]CAG9577047.1 RNA_binding_protein_-_putative [Leishmania major strain Friedlin]CAJ04712.1 putative RNA binding protein [Leishmania major strain Friedlin]|eukprot:XP_001684294.1 putative RNA binding protein [Leishmania major strain Friedlin]